MSDLFEPTLLVEPRLLDINEAAEMLHCSVAKVRQMVIGDRTLAAVHEDYQGFRTSFQLGGLRLFDVDVLGVISVRGRGREPAGFLRFDLAEVFRVLSEQAHWEANAVPLSELFPPALKESESSALACAVQPQAALGAIPVVAETAEQRQDRRLTECEAAGLVMPKHHKGRLPDGVGKFALGMEIKRQSLSWDLKAALKRRESAIREGRTFPRA